MADWNPALYTRFEDERTRPAAELLARVPLAAPLLACDLGCGPGNSTALIAARYPGAEVIGLDASPAMLASARARLPGLAFALADAATWIPERAPDLIYANAVLQWLPDHAACCRGCSASSPRAACSRCRCPTTSPSPPIA